ncbi:MAG: Trm112 family protein [Stenotrophomonas sp.]|uniref:Trm112 family protein n=1 Tax=Stenotrophomonas sp. TaxID=69392 RepID=UPI0028B0EEEE|nr:Trm112 family protein [Stenotrophomonas sp.]
MDRKLLDLLVAPDTRQPLALLESAGLDAINRAIGAGALLRADGSAQAQPLREALITADRKTVYRVDDGIPVLLADEAIATAQIADFPAK